MRSSRERAMGDRPGEDDRAPAEGTQPRGVAERAPAAEDCVPAAADRARWEWPASEVRRVGQRVVELIARHLETLPERPVVRPFPADLAARYASSPLPEQG